MNFLKSLFMTIGTIGVFLVIWTGLSILGACLWIISGWNILMISFGTLVLAISLTVTWANDRHNK